MDYKAVIAQSVQQRIMEVFGADAAGFPETVEIPPDSKMGDFAVPCFPLAKTLRMGPPVIAQKLADGMEVSAGFARVENVGGYLNFFLDRAAFAGDTVSAVLEQGDRYGSSDIGKGKTILIDYSSINIAKRFHMGHLSTTMIGHALRRVFEHLGYTCVGINHLGDWGTQFGKIVAAYRLWGSKEEVELGGIEAVTELYVKFTVEAEKDPALENEGRLWSKKIEDGDPEAIAIFDWLKELTLRYADEMYKLLGVTFDSYAGESFYIDKTSRVVEELREKGLLVESDGAWIVDLEEDGMPPCIILRRDGATLYHTRDIAAALYRKDTYDFDECLYVVAYQQDLHFRQLFRVIEKMGYDWAKNLKHIAFGMVSFEGEAMKTRTGHVVHLEEVLEQAITKARAVIEEKSPHLENKDEIARQVGVGSVVFFDLYNNRIKDIDFWFDRALAFEGETCPYVQYTHARGNSVLVKAPEDLPAPDWSALEDDEAQAVVRELYRIPEIIAEVRERYEPSLIARHCVDLAQAYNHYYYEHRILGEDAAGSAARLALTRAVKSALKTCLYLIGIEAPERM